MERDTVFFMMALSAVGADVVYRWGLVELSSVFILPIADHCRIFACLVEREAFQDELGVSWIGFILDAIGFPLNDSVQHMNELTITG